MEELPVAEALTLELTAKTLKKVGESYARELACQILARLKFTERWGFLLKNPGLIWAYLLRVRKMKGMKVFGIESLWKNDDSKMYKIVKVLEQKLQDLSDEEVDKLHRLCSDAAFIQLKLQRMKSMNTTKRVKLLVRSPRMLLSYLRG